MCFKGINSDFKMNVELQINTVPRHDGFTPVFSDVSHGDKGEFFKGIFGGERSFCFGDFSDTPVQTFNWLSGIHDGSDGLGIFVKSSQAFLVAGARSL